MNGYYCPICKRVMETVGVEKINNTDTQRAYLEFSQAIEHMQMHNRAGDRNICCVKTEKAKSITSDRFWSVYFGGGS